MADFLTRLVERTWGVLPVVKPVINPRFSPENLPEQNSVVGFDIEDNSEQINLTDPQFNSQHKTQKNISPELPAIPETEENSQSFLEVEEEFLTNSNSAEIQTFSRREEFEHESKISASQSSSPAITNSQINPLSSQNPTQKLTQKDVPLIKSQIIKSQNFSAVNINHVTVNHDSPKLTQNQDNYLKSKPEFEQPENDLNSSDEPTFLPAQERVNLLVNSDVKKLQIGKKSESNFSHKLFHNSAQKASIQPSQKQPKSQALEQPVPPTIQVRIGRIEVRANTPPPRTKFPVQSPKRPRLSLDEYLRSNSGGKP